MTDAELARKVAEAAGYEMETFLGGTTIKISDGGRLVGYLYLDPPPITPGSYRPYEDLNQAFAAAYRVFDSWTMMHPYHPLGATGVEFRGFSGCSTNVVQVDKAFDFNPARAICLAIVEAVKEESNDDD